MERRSTYVMLPTGAELTIWNAFCPHRFRTLRPSRLVPSFKAQAVNAYRSLIARTRSAEHYPPYGQRRPVRAAYHLMLKENEEGRGPIYMIP